MNKKLIGTIIHYIHLCFALIISTMFIYNKINVLFIGLVINFFILFLWAIWGGCLVSYIQSYYLNNCSDTSSAFNNAIVYYKGTKIKYKYIIIMKYIPIITILIIMFKINNRIISNDK